MAHDGPSRNDRGYMDMDGGQQTEEIMTYTTGLELPLQGPPMRMGEIWHYSPEKLKVFQRVTLTLHINGMNIRPPGGQGQFSVAWSPFALVHSVRLHTEKADAAVPHLRFFKVLVFHHGSLHFFGTDGEDAESDRAHWVAVIAKSHREFTQSLFPCFALATGPLPGSETPSTRLLAGYLLQCEGPQVSLVWCELHLQFDGAAYFDGYATKSCETPILGIVIESGTQISKAQGVDNSCFTLGGCNFAARSCAEKELWLRVIQNVKVKLLHSQPQTVPTPEDTKTYRAAILERVQRIEKADELDTNRTPLLPKAMSVSRQKAAPTQSRYGSRPKGADAPEEQQSGTRHPTGDTPFVNIKAFAPTRKLENKQPPSKPMFMGGTPGEDDTVEFGGGGYGGNNSPPIGAAAVGAHGAMGIRPAAGDSPVMDDGMPPQQDLHSTGF